MTIVFSVTSLMMVFILSDIIERRELNVHTITRFHPEIFDWEEATTSMT
jgi:hypothetical protein